MTAVIALTGKKGSGKSTIATMLTAICAEKSITCTTFSFATPLKMACHIVFGGEPAHWWGGKKEEILPHLGRTPRELMQKFGTEFVRDMIDPDLWVKAMETSLNDTKKLFEDRGVIIIDDLRFDNEAALVVDKFVGYAFEIRLEGYVPENVESAHPSERGVDRVRLHNIYTCAKGDHDSLRNISKRIFTSAVRF